MVSGVVCHPRNTTVLQEASPNSVRVANCRNRAVGEASRFMQELINWTQSGSNPILECSGDGFSWMRRT